MDEPTGKASRSGAGARVMPPLVRRRDAAEDRSVSEPDRSAAAGSGPVRRASEPAPAGSGPVRRSSGLTSAGNRPAPVVSTGVRRASEPSPAGNRPASEPERTSIPAGQERTAPWNPFAAALEATCPDSVGRPGPAVAEGGPVEGGGGERSAAGTRPVMNLGSPSEEGVPGVEGSEKFFDIPGWEKLSDLQRAWVIEYVGCWDAGEAALRVGVERRDGWLMRGNRQVSGVLRCMQEMAASERVLGLTESMEILTGMVRTSVVDFLKSDGSGELDMEKVRREGRYLEEVEYVEDERRGKEGEVLGVRRKAKVKVGRREALVILAKLRGWDLRGGVEQGRRELVLGRESAGHGVVLESGGGGKGLGGGGFRLTMCLTAKEGESAVEIPEPVMLPGRRAVGGVLEIDVSNQAVVEGGVG